jgi:hypothetical protein
VDYVEQHYGNKKGGGRKGRRKERRGGGRVGREGGGRTGREARREGGKEEESAEFTSVNPIIGQTKENKSESGIQHSFEGGVELIEKKSCEGHPP